jgi:predicted nucleic acid-binding protein
MSCVLVDTSVWVVHFRQADPGLVALLARDEVGMHPLVWGELACGTPPQRGSTLKDLRSLQLVQQASLQETVDFVEREHLYGLGCGLIDMQLLASTLLTPQASLWTLDRRLAGLAQRFGVCHEPARH